MIYIVSEQVYMIWPHILNSILYILNLLRTSMQDRHMQHMHMCPSCKARGIKSCLLLMASIASLTYMPKSTISSNSSIPHMISLPSQETLEVTNHLVNGNLSLLSLNIYVPNFIPAQKTPLSSSIPLYI